MAMRKSKGRQKVEMVRMAKDSNRQVTFSKRRTGLFKKASELCTLCGADVAIVVFSPGNKVFSFGHPSVDSVVDRYFSRNTAPSQNSGTLQLIEAHRNATVQELNAELTQVGNQLEKEKKRGEYLANMMKAERRGCWWENPVDQLEKPQLEQLKAGLENLKKKVAKQADKILSSGNAAQLFGRPGISNMNLMNPNSGFYPPQTDPDEFEQKNILGGPSVPAAAPVMNMNMNMNMNNLNMALMMPPPPPGYNNLDGAQFNSFGRGFF